MRRVLFISNNQIFGGSEVLWLQVALELAKSGYVIGIHIYRWSNTPPVLEHLKSLGAHIFYFPAGGLIQDWVMKVKRKIFGDRPVWQSFGPDLAIISYGYHLRTSLQPSYCQKLNIPYFNNFQLVSEFTKAAEPRYVREIQGALHNYFPSKQNRDMLSRQLAEHVHQSRVIHNTWQVDFETPFRWPEVSDTFNLAFVGRLDVYHKGLDLLLEALQQSKWRERNLHIDFYGSGKAQFYLEKLAVHYGITNIAFKGQVSNVQEIWSNHQALVLTSRQEGMSLALIEAMLCGRVPITTSVGGALELIEPGISGFVAQAPTVAFIDQALEEAWQQRARWKDIGKAAYQRIRLLLRQKPLEIIMKDMEDHFNKKVR